MQVSIGEVLFKLANLSRVEDLSNLLTVGLYFVANHWISKEGYSGVGLIRDERVSFGDGSFAADGLPSVEPDVVAALGADEQVVVFGVALKAFFPCEFVFP